MHRCKYFCDFDKFTLQTSVSRVPVKCETKQKRNGTKQIETKRNKSKRNETDRNETKQIETKRNQSKRNETNRNETKRVVWNAKLTYTQLIRELFN